MCSGCRDRGFQCSLNLGRSLATSCALFSHFVWRWQVIYLVCFVFVDLSRASCDCLSLSLWKVSVSSGLSRDNSFWREWIASQWCWIVSWRWASWVFWEEWWFVLFW